MHVEDDDHRERSDPETQGETGSEAERLPGDAPNLIIMADTRWGCGSIKTSAAADAS